MMEQQIRELEIQMKHRSGEALEALYQTYSRLNHEFELMKDVYKRQPEYSVNRILFSAPSSPIDLSYGKNRLTVHGKEKN